MYTLEEGRAYRHRKCQGETIIQGKDFSGICNPARIGNQTFCAVCMKMDRLINFRWVDTGENLKTYRDRMKEIATPFMKAWPSISAIIGAIAGGLFGFFVSWYFIRDITPIAIATFTGLSIGAIVMQSFIGTIVANSLGGEFYKNQ